jgi:hypothetical protein
MTTPDPPPRIFISSSPADRNFVLRLAGDLREMLGEDAVWFDVGETRAGEGWRAQVSQTILASSILLVILSPDAVSSHSVQDEIALAQTSAKRIIPVLVRPCAVPPSLAGLQSVSFLGRSYGESLVDLLAAIEPDLSRGITLPAAPSAGEDGVSEVGQGAPSSTPVLRAPPPAETEPQPTGDYGGFPADQTTLPAPRPREESPTPPMDARTSAPTGAPPLGARGGRRPERERRDRQEDVSARTLRFSAFHPNEFATGEWGTLLVYAYVNEAVAQIQADAATFAELGSSPVEAQTQSTRRVRQGVELTIEPHVDGVAFSPASDTFIWREDWHRSLFRLMADANLAGATQKGWIDIYAGRMSPIASIDVTFSFHHAIAKASLSASGGMMVTANTFDTVFVSYSHRDEEAMRQARRVYDQLGITVLVDELLQAGDNFDERLLEMIAAANVFHLLWSRHSAASDDVRNEWTTALASGKGDRFIRPWYWKKPLVRPPSEMAVRRISFKYERLKRRMLKPSTWF